MKKLLLNLFLLAVGISTGFAQTLTYKKDVNSPFFEQVNFQGAFPVHGSGKYSSGVTLYGNTIKKSDGSTWIPANDDWTKDWTNWDPETTIYPGDAAFSGTFNGYVNGVFTAGLTSSIPGTYISGDIASNVTWGSSDGSLTLVRISGAIHVLNGATVTIKPNTIIRGDPSNISFFLVCKGAKLNAIGFPDKPIVFTSSKAPGSRTSGDWAGFLLMGKSQNNTSPNGTGVRRFEALPADPLSEYGGGANFDIHDNSGEMRFLRVEFAGYNYLPDQEINGVTFGAVGDQTRFDFCMVSYSRDDSYEWFGGSSDHKYLVCWAGIDDEFDQDEGYQGRLQFCLGVRKFDIFETSAGGSSHGFEHDNNTGWGTSAQNVVGINNPQPSTRPTMCNITQIGPRYGNIPNVTGNRFNAGMAYRTGDETCTYNSIVLGYPRQFEFFHNGATLTPSAQQKYIGVSDVSGSLAFGGTDLVTGKPYVKNEVHNTILITDVNDTRSGKGPVNGATLESQAVPNGGGILSATFDPANGNFLSGGTSLDNNGFPTIYDQAQWNNNRNTTIDATTIFAQGIPYSILSGNGSGNGTVGLNSYGTTLIVTPDFTLSPTAPITLNNTSYTPTILAGSILNANSFSFSYGPASLPQLFQTLGVPSSPIEINVTAFGLTSTGISIAVSGSGFQVSTDGSTYSTSANLSVTGGSFWVRYNALAAGNSTGSISINPNDGRVTIATISNIQATAIAPSVPFVQASVGQLANTYVTLLNTAGTSSVFTVSGNLLTDNVTVSSSVNFQVSSDNATWSNMVIYTVLGAKNKLLMPTLVYARYYPTVTNNHVTVTGGAIVAGNDDGVITISSPSAVSETVNIIGNWGVNVAVGPVDANGNIIQNGSAISFPQFLSYTGLPSAPQRTWVKATGVPAGQTVIVHNISGLELSTLPNSNFAPADLTFTPDAIGNVPATPIYVRYKGTGSLGNYGATGGSVLAVGISGTTVFDVVNGLQGATESIGSVATNLFGYIVTVTGNAATITNVTPIVGNTVAGFTNANLGVGSIITSANAGASVFSFQGIVTSIDAVNNIVYIDRNFATTAVNQPLYYSTKGKIGSVTVSGVTGNVISLTTGFTPNPNIGAPLYLSQVKAGSLVGVITSFDGVANTVTFDNTNVEVLPTVVPGSVLLYDNSQVMYNVQSDAWQSNKDYNRAAIWFTNATLADATHATPTTGQIITVSGFNTPNLMVGRDQSTVYALAVEVSLDNVNYSPYILITSTGIVPPTPVWVRYNPTGPNTSGIIAGSPTTLPGFGQHTGSILEQNTNNYATGLAYSGSRPVIYTVGFSDPLLYTSATPVSFATNPQVRGQIVNQLSDLYAIVGTTSQPTPLYVYGSRLENGVIAITSSDPQYKFSTDLSTWSSSLNLNGTNNLLTTVYVNYTPTSTISGSASISLSTTKSQQSVHVNGFSIPVPTPYIQTSEAVLTVNIGSMGYLTVSGGNIASPITVTAPSGFMVWATSGSYSNSVTLAPNTLNYGDVLPTQVLVTFTGTTSASSSLLSLATTGYMTSVTLTGSVVTAITQALSDETKLTLYPNPSNGDVTIALGLSKQDEVSGVIYDYTGSIVKSFTTTMSPEVSTYQVSGLTSGFYVVSISTSTGRKTVKLVVQ